MEIPIPIKIRRLWNIWDLRVLITGSLLLQAILIMLAWARKRTGSKLVIFVIWMAYLLADWVAAVAIGHASSSQLLAQPTTTTTAATNRSGDLLAFWAPFLLLHLGGPDSITSFSLEDNELRLRHLLGLVLQFVAVVYVFSQTLPGNKLWAQTMLVLVAGTIKYAERTRALYIASFDRFGVSVLPCPDPGTEYEKISSRISFVKKSSLPTSWRIVPNPERKHSKSISEDDRSLLETGYTIFNMFKGLIVGQIFSSEQRETSRNFFMKRNATEAFKLVELELSFIYEVLHTKLAVVRSRLGYTLRLICFSLIVTSFVTFMSMDKKRFNKFDQSLTFSLLVSAMILEIISFVMLIFSDWTAISLKDNKFGKFISYFVQKKKRWSESVSQCNLIDYCLAKRSEGLLDKFAKLLGLDDLLNKMLIMLASVPRSHRVEDNLKELIFKELKRKSKDACTIEKMEELCSWRKAKVLLKDHSKLLEWTMDQGNFQYTESLLLWHIATDLCYCSEGDESSSSSDDDDTKLCKLLSDYMFYLQVMKAKMMAPVAGNWQLVFQDTCAEAKRFFQKSSSSNKLSDEKREACKQVLPVETDYRSAMVKGDKSKSVMFDASSSNKLSATPVAGNWQLVFQYTCAEANRFFHKLSPSNKSSDKKKQACNDVLSVETDYRSAMVKGDKSKSVMFDACMLAKSLKKLDQKERWKVMSQVWVEFMSYAAINCRPTVHAEQTSTGGELLTFVWLLNTRLGLGKQFYHQESVEKVKVLPPK